MIQIPKLEEIADDVVPMGFARALVLEAIARNVDAKWMLETSRFPFDPLQHDSQAIFISAQAYSRLCATLFTAMDDESGGIMDDGRTPPGTLRLMALAMINSSDLGSAMRRAIEFNAICRLPRSAVVSNHLRVNSDKNEATLSYLCDKTNAANQHHTLSGLAMWLRFCGWMIAQPLDGIAAQCAGPRPEDQGGLRHFFSCPITFSQEVNSISFSSRHLDAPIVRDEAELESFLKLAPYHMVIRPMVSAGTITHRIREILGDDFRVQMPSFEQLTTLMNMSARTLRRRLESEGTSYQRIKDNARRDKAIMLLSGPENTVSDVAEQLGFSDPSAFHRSFKKWTGQSPGSFRC
ncbi:MAG: AraC family transcriptional regulator ligand-binding domain-containing protein [Pseudomonadota bacterium]